MRRLVRLFALSALGVSLAAQASTNDYQVYQLGNPTPGGPGYSPVANGNFRAFAREVAAGLTSATLTPPDTLGVDGFAVNAEVSVVNFRPGTSFLLPTERPFQGPELMPSVHFRKGLPWSLEVGARVTYLDRSSMAAATGELKCALTEGIPYLPVLSARLYATRLFNTQDFSLASGGLDVSLGKRFAVGGMVTLTPYGGYVLSFAAATSHEVDFARSTSAAEAEASPGAPYANAAVYGDVVWNQNLYQRLYAGLRFMAGVFQLGGEVSYSLPGSFTDTPTNGVAPSTRALPNILAVNATVGLDF